ncbi:MAG: hypothetical protein J6O41_03110 [Clostridia bacterium]|nr:hypothetical protein [Clostridia bacterium]
MNTKKKAIIKGILSSIIIFISGYGMLSIIYFYWLHTTNSINLKGLYDYKASAIGDPICLPILIGCLVVYIEYFNYMDYLMGLAYIT